MYKQLFSVFLFVISIVFLSSVEGEPEVLMVSINPSDVDNQQEEEITFEGDCNVCNEEQLSYFYWNSSISGVLREGSNHMDLNFIAMSSRHRYTFKERMKRWLCLMEVYLKEWNLLVIMLYQN